MEDLQMLPPPWVRHPDEPRFTSSWYTGPSECETGQFSEQLEPLSVEQRIAFFRGHAPVPALWADWVASMVYDDWDHANDDETAAVVRRLQDASGLVDLAAWEKTLAGGAP